METFYIISITLLCLVTALVIYYIIAWHRATLWFHRLTMVTSGEKVRLSFDTPPEKKAKKFSIKLQPKIRQVFKLTSPNTKHQQLWHHELDTSKTFKIVKIPNYVMQQVHSEPYLLSDTDAFTVSTIPERWIHLFMIENSLQSQEEVKVTLVGYEYAHQITLHTPRSPFKKLSYPKTTEWRNLPYIPRVEYYQD